MRSETTQLPVHVAIIMDGNGRWARSKGLERVLGHRRGTETVRNVVTRCRERGVGYLTLYAFSDENWKRPALETSFLMSLLEDFLVSERKLMRDKDIRLSTIGEIDRLPHKTRKVLDETLAATRDHRSMVLNLALSYGGRGEILRAARALATDARDGKLDPAAIDEEAFAARLDTRALPDPDLIIRTSGELRTSNFLPWQATYAEWYITDTLWPDFTADEFDAALTAYAGRERRFGQTGEQVAEKRTAP